MSSFRPGRFAGTFLGTVAILAIGVYGPFALLAPLPTPTVATIGVDAPVAADLALSIEGSSAVRAANAEQPLAQSGEATALPMAAITKVITALVVLDAKPMEAGETGESLTITTADYGDYIDYSNEGARTVIVIPGEVWTEREALQALLLGSSNNHADTLARWAFGSIDEFVAASAGWLSAAGLPNTTLADATGLSAESVGTAADLSRLAELAMANPVIDEILANPATTLVNDRGVSNTTPFLEQSGVTGISRSYTDDAGVCFLFRLTVDSETGEVPLYGAVLGSPGYEGLERGVQALAQLAPGGIQPVTVIAEGTAYATVETTWGQRADVVAGNDVAVAGWELDGSSPRPTISAGALDGNVSANKEIGRVVITTLSSEPSAPLVLDAAIRDPGPLWRLTNPLALLASLFESSN